MDHDAELSIDGEVVRLVTIPAYSQRLGMSLAPVHLVPSAAAEGTPLELNGPAVLCRAKVVSTLFVDAG